MTHNDLKVEIQKVIDNIPDALLEEILRILKVIEEKSKQEEYPAGLAQKIFDEDKKLLRKLG